MASSSGHSGGAITGINVTPLVDITLVLLIVFMVTAKLVVNQRALVVDLPKAASGQAVQEILAVEVTAAGGVRVDGVPLGSDDELIGKARAGLRRTRELRAVIQADTAVPHGRVVHVLDRLRQAGIVKVGFGVTAAPASSAQSEP
jgi:biopolymer transport protein ExbD